MSLCVYSIYILYINVCDSNPHRYRHDPVLQERETLLKHRVPRYHGVDTVGGCTRRRVDRTILSVSASASRLCEPNPSVPQRQRSWFTPLTLALYRICWSLLWTIPVYSLTTERESENYTSAKRCSEQTRPPNFHGDSYCMYVFCANFCNFKYTIGWRWIE